MQIKRIRKNSKEVKAFNGRVFCLSLDNDFIAHESTGFLAARYGSLAAWLERELSRGARLHRIAENKATLQIHSNLWFELLGI